MKTPDEIKKGLECCTSCKPEDCCVCAYKANDCKCVSMLTGDALAYIQQLETNNHQLLTVNRQLHNSMFMRDDVDFILKVARSELEFRLPRWIPVEERLPDNDIQYLTYTTARECVVCYYNGDGDWISDWASNDSPDVTHWMPLPEPPEEN